MEDPLKQQVLEKYIEMANDDPIVDCLKDENGAKYFKDKAFVYKRDFGMKWEVCLVRFFKRFEEFSLEYTFSEIENKFNSFLLNDLVSIIEENSFVNLEEVDMKNAMADLVEKSPSYLPKSEQRNLKEKFYNMKQEGDSFEIIVNNFYNAFVALSFFVHSEGFFSSADVINSLNVLSEIREDLLDLISMKTVGLSLSINNDSLSRLKAKEKIDKGQTWADEFFGKTDLFRDVFLSYCLKEGFIDQEYVDLEKSGKNNSELEINFQSLLEIALEHSFKRNSVSSSF